MGKSRDYAACHLYPAEARQADVEHSYIRLVFADQSISIFAIGGLGNNGDFTGALEQAPIAFSHDRVVIDQHYPQRF